MKFVALYKKAIIIAISVMMMITMYPTLQYIINGEGYVQAASVSTAASMASTAKSLVGTNRSKIQPSGDWCAAFAYYCAKKSGNGSLVGSSNIVGPQARDTVNNKGGTITFVNHTIYTKNKSLYKKNCIYDSNYKPKPGDLVLYNWSGEKHPYPSDLGSAYSGKYMMSHVGVVVSAQSSNSHNDFYSVEGNTGSNTSVVQNPHRTKNNVGNRAVAFVTPKYNGTTTVDTSEKTVASKGIVYKLSAKSTIYESASTSSKVVKKDLPAGSNIYLLGKEGSWNKIKFLKNGTKTKGFVKGNVVRLPNNGGGRVTVSNVGSFSMKAGKGHDVTYKINSVYPIYGIMATYKRVDGASQSSPWATSASSLYNNVSATWGNLQAANNNTKKLSAGEYTLTVTCKDVFGNVGSSSTTIYVTSSINAPTITDTADAEEKRTVNIKQNSSGTLYYKVGNASYQSTISANKTLPISTEGNTVIQAYTKGKSSSDTSLITRKTISLKRLQAPTITVEQNGHIGTVVINAEPGATIYYTINGEKQKYNNPFEVTGNTTITSYATKKGALKSSVNSIEAELAEPKTPDVKLMNDSNKIAEGKTASFSWKPDKRAECYKASLYNADDDEIVDSYTTNENTVTFTLPEAGEYYVKVVASNELGDSDESNPVTVFAKAPLKVVFIDQGEMTTDESGEELVGEGHVLNDVMVRYGECPEAIDAPMKKGHTFTGWRNTNTGVSSINGYLKSPITEDTIYEAQYEANTYTVKLFDPEGKLLDTQKIKYGKAANTNDLEESIISGLKIGYKFTGWQVTYTSEGDSKADLTKVDSDMDAHAVVSWANAELPVIVNITEAKVTADNKVVVDVNLYNKEDEDLSFYLIMSLKAKDDEKGVDQTVYSDRKIVYLDANKDNSSEKTIRFTKKTTEVVNSVEVVAVQCDEDMNTRSTYSELVKSDIVKETGALNWGEYSSWGTTPISASETRQVETKIEYKYREKERTTSGSDSLGGWTKESTKTISTSYGNWTRNEPSISGPVVSGNTKTTVSLESKSTHQNITYFCNCKKTYYRNKSGTCSSCGKSTTNHLYFYTSTSLAKSGYSGNQTDGYKLPKTIGTDSPGKMGIIYCMYTGDGKVSSFTSASSSMKGWKYEPSPTRTVYRKKTVVTQNTFWRWGGWKTSNTPVTATSDRQLGDSTTYYRYRDAVPEEEAVDSISIDKENVSKPISGNLNVEDNLNGKYATIMVYQANNTDPNKYQLKYLGQTTIGEKNSYSFRIALKEMPNTLTGNYIVALGVQGTTGLINVDLIEAPKPKYTVGFYYENKKGERVQIGENQIVKAGDSAEIPKVNDGKLTDAQVSDGYTDISKEGYCFIGWSQSTSNISRNTEFDALYVKLRNAVVFVDWVNQTIEQQNAFTDDEVYTPGAIEDADGYKFKGWKLENGSLYGPGEKFKVTGNMIITAEYEADSYLVRFLDIDGGVIDTQNVEYGKSANPPAYTGNTNGGEFVSWSTENSWWNVNDNIDVRPITVYPETAAKPVAEIQEDDNTGKRTMSLSVPEEENAQIFYTTGDIEPSLEMIQDYNSGIIDGGIQKYSNKLSFEADTTVLAVAYVESKNLSDVLDVDYEVEADTTADEFGETDESERPIIGEYEVKAKAGKDVTVSVSLDDNPGLMNYSIFIEGDNETFYTDVDDYGEPVVVLGDNVVDGRVRTSATPRGWQVNWYGDKLCTNSGKLFSMILHVDEEAEARFYPLSVGYNPDDTFDDTSNEVSLKNARVEISSEAVTPIDSKEISLSRYSYVYEGQAIEPAVRIEGLKEGTDFTVSYENNMDVGTGKVIVTGIGDCAGVVEKEFTISQANIANADIAEIPDVGVTGDTVEPKLPISFNGVALERNKDYEATFTDNVEVGTATVTVKGIGNFKGQTEAQFNLVETTESKLEKAEKKLKEAEAKVDELTKAKEQAEAEVKEAREAQTAAETEAKRAREEMASARSEAEAAKLEKEAMEATVTAARAAQATAEAEAKSAKIAQQEAEARADAAEAGKQKLETELTTAKTEKEAAEKQAALDKAARENAEAQVIAAQAAQATAEANERAAQQEKAVAELQTQRAKEQLAQKETELADAIREKESLEADANTSRQALEQAEARVRELTSGKEAAEAALEKANQAKEQAETRQKQAEADKNAAEKQVEKLTKEKQALEEQIKEQAGGTGQKEQTGENSHESASGKTVKKPTAVKVTVPGTSITKLKKGKKKMTVKWKKVSGAAGYQIQYSQSGSFSSGNKMVNVAASKKAKLKVKKLQKKKIYFVHIRTYKKVGGKTYYSKWSATRSVKVK